MHNAASVALHVHKKLLHVVEASIALFHEVDPMISNSIANEDDPLLTAVCSLTVDELSTGYFGRVDYSSSDDDR